jgi:nucleoside-diphosphate-sugar epimerase
MGIPSKVYMKIFITGARGFAGSYLVKKLDTLGFSIFASEACLENFDALKHELSIFLPDFVIHLGASSFVGNTNYINFYTVNLMGTKNLLEAIKLTCPNIIKVIVTSSAAVYGNLYSGLISEDMKPKPSNDYGVSKLAMEFVSDLYRNDIPIVITRPFNFTGVGQSNNFVIPKIVDSFRYKKTEIELGNLDVFREFGDVRDFVDYYISLIKYAQAGQVFNICNGLLYSLNDVIEHCKFITGRDINISTNSKFVRKGEIMSLGGNPEFLFDSIKMNNSFTLKDTLTWMLEI